MVDPGADGTRHVRQARRRRPQFKPIFLNVEQIARLFEVLARDSTVRGKRDLALASVLTLMGLRSNEARMLDIDDVRFANQELVIRFAKGGKRRTIPLYSAVATAVTEWLAVRPSARAGDEAALFLSGEGSRIANRTIRADANRWAIRADLPAGFHAHSCRHTAVVRLRQRGVSLEAVRDFVGHSSIAITNLYSHLDSEHLREEIGKAAW